MHRVTLCLLLLALVFSPVLAVQSAATAQADVLPAYFDWRAQGMVTPVRAQGGCVAARAFAATAMLESAILIAGGPRVDLSEQYLLNCNDRGLTCQNSGGWDILDFYQDAFLAPNTLPGAVLESAMPYRGKTAVCTRVSKHPYRIARWGTLSDGQASIEQIQRAVLDYGAVAIGVCAAGAFANYTGGLFETDESQVCAAQGLHTNHVVNVVGWDNAGRFWIVKNSWGKDWGEAGYMLLRYGISNGGYDSAYLVYGAPPPAPTLVTPSAGAVLPVGGAALGWKRAAGAQTYRVEVASDANFASLVLEGETGETLFVPTDLPPNAALWWRVGACRVVDGLPVCSVWSSPRSFKTRPRAPLPEWPVGGAAVESLRPTFQWSQADDSARFDVQIASDAAFKHGLRSVTVAGAGYTPGSDLARLRALFWRVRARGRYGTGGWSETQTFFTPDPPAAPKLLAPASGALLQPGEMPVLRWSIPAGEVTGYRVEVAHSQLFEEKLVQAEVTETAYGLGFSLAPDALYFWRVRAVGQGGALSNWSAPRSLKTRPAAPVLLLPADGTLADSLRPLLTWQSANTRFDVQIARQPGCAKLYRSATVSATQYRPSSNLPRGTELFWRVRARGRYGTGAWSACQGFQTPP